MAEPKCPDCNAVMESGVVVDRADMDIPKQQEWVEGMPERSFWLGEGFKLKGKERLQVTAYRCPKCGLLKSYARGAQPG